MPRTPDKKAATAAASTTDTDDGKVRVRITEDRLRDAGYDLSKGDSITVSAELAQYWVGLGWADDPTGNIATGERIPGARAPLDVQDAPTRSGG